MRKPNTLRRGMTLIEMLVVILVLGIVAMAVIPGFASALRHSRLNAAAGAVVDALDFARLSAMASGQSAKVTVSVSSGRIQVQGLIVDNLSDVLDPTKTELSEGNVEVESWTLMDHPLERGQKYDIDLNGGYRFSGARIVASDFGTGGETVEFNAYGVPSSSGQVAVALGSLSAQVSLDPLSGIVTVSN